MRSLIDIVDLTVEEIDDLIATANDIIANPDKYAEKCHRKKMATLFFEPSTRTRALLLRKLLFHSTDLLPDIPRGMLLWTLPGTYQPRSTRPRNWLSGLF